MKEYTQQMRINQEPCPYCGFWHSAASHPLQFASYVQEIQRLEVELTATKVAKTLCIWTQDEEGNWNTSCEEIFILLDETTPAGNSMRYCPFCGGGLVQNIYIAERDEDDS